MIALSGVAVVAIATGATAVGKPQSASRSAPVMLTGPVGDHHQHLPSAAAIALLNRAKPNALPRRQRTVEGSSPPFRGNASSGRAVHTTAAQRG